MLGVRFEEQHNPSLEDLSYITDYTTSRQQVHPALSQSKVDDFLPRIQDVNLRIVCQRA
jgi:hypothetical protein